jgi:hypothetical protein
LHLTPAGERGDPITCGVQRASPKLMVDLGFGQVREGLTGMQKGFSQK